MNIVLHKSELREAVAGFNKIITRRSTLPVLGCVRFDAGNHGVTAQATDLDQTAVYRFAQAEAGGDGTCILPFAHLKDLAKGSNGDQVAFETQGEHIAVTNRIGGHAIRQVVPGTDPEEWPELKLDLTTVSAAGFLEAYRRLLPFASTDSTRAVLNGVYVDTSGKGARNITMVSTDGRRLTALNSMRLPIAESLIVPASRFLAGTRLAADTTIGVRKTENGTLFGLQAGAWRYIVRSVEGTYPNYRQVIPSAAGDCRLRFSDESVTWLNKALPTFPGGEEIVFRGEDGRVTIHGRGPDDEHGTSLALDAVVYEGPRAVIGLNRHYLLEALAAGFRDFAFTDENSPLVARDASGGLHVLMPVRVNDPEARATSITAGEPEQPEHPIENNPSAPVRVDTEQKGTEPMPRKTEPTETAAASALERAMSVYDEARSRLRELQLALNTAGAELKAALRDQKAQAKEMDSARTALSKLQAISL